MFENRFFKDPATIDSDLSSRWTLSERHEDTSQADPPSLNI